MVDNNIALRKTLGITSSMGLEFESGMWSLGTGAFRTLLRGTPLVSFNYGSSTALTRIAGLVPVSSSAGLLRFSRICCE